MKLLITGGHFTPALAVIECIRSSPRYRDIELVFVGRQYTEANHAQSSLEYQEIRKHKVPFIHLDTSRFTRLAVFKTLLQLVTIPLGFIRAWIIVKRVRPDVVLSFGGYIGLPIAYSAYLQGIPVYTHEQTVRPGLANRLIAKIARTVFISFPESRAFIKAKHIMLSGNPVRKHPHPSHLLQIPAGELIYITGGSLGSHSINALVAPIMPALLKQYTVIHQAGNVTQYQDLPKAQALRDTLAPDLKERYVIKSHLTGAEVEEVLSKASLVISRAGANTLFELIAFRKPAILIPLPWSAYGEQPQQAAIFAHAGVAQVFLQARPSHELLDLIGEMMGKLTEYTAHFTNLEHLYRDDAAHIITAQILQ